MNSEDSGRSNKFLTRLLPARSRTGSHNSS